MKILVFGKTGQVAREIQGQADVAALSRQQADLTDADRCAEIIRESSADFVINAAAYTAVDRAEKDQEIAFQVNAIAPTRMAEAAARLQIPFVQISTDYVFDGSGDLPKKTTDLTGPLGIYGKSKLAGETGIKAAAGQFVILRTSWVFSPWGDNFVKTMLGLSRSHSTLKVVADQMGAPTPAKAVASACLNIGKRLKAGSGRKGVYHLCGTPHCSWADFAVEIFNQSGLDIDVEPVSSEEFPTTSERPLNSMLDCSEIERDYGISQPDWRDALGQTLKKLGVS